MEPLWHNFYNENLGVKISLPAFVYIAADNADVFLFFRDFFLFIPFSSIWNFIIDFIKQFKISPTLSLMKFKIAII